MVFCWFIASRHPAPGQFPGREGAPRAPAPAAWRGGAKGCGSGNGRTPICAKLQAVDYEFTTLSNGLRVATASMPHMRSVSVALYLGVGSRYEPARLNGICHFIEHLLFKGTRKRSARQISQAVEGIGGALNAFTSEEVTCFHARACAAHLPLLLDVLMDMLLGSRFDPADVAKEREVIKEEISMYWDEPQHLVQEAFNALMWPDQPLGRPITGTAESLDAIGRGELVNYLRGNYVAASAVVVAAGRVTHRQVLRAASRFVPRFPRGPRPRFELSRNHQTAPRVRLITRQNEQTQMALGFRTCSRYDERRYALRVLNTILGENMSSRLFQVVREERGLTYSIYSNPSFFADTGDLVIAAGLDTDKLPRALRLILSEVRRLKNQPVSAAELRRARDYLLGQLELAQESTESQMNWTGDHLLSYNRVPRPAEMKRHITRVTAAQIMAAARDFFRPERLNLALVSPLKTAASITACLRV